MGISEITQYFVFLLLNLAIATCGTILLAFGAILQRDEWQDVKNFTTSIGGFSIGVGVLVFTVACIGYGALFLRKPSMLTTYTVLVLIMFIIQIILGSIALASLNDTKCEQDEDMEKLVAQLFLRQDPEGVKARDHLQKSYKCCGVNEPSWWKIQTNSFPPSCCPGLKDPCEDPYRKGCALIYSQNIDKNMNVIGGVAIGFAVCELAAAILAWFIRVSIIKNEYYY